MQTNTAMMIQQQQQQQPSLIRSEQILWDCSLPPTTTATNTSTLSTMSIESTVSIHLVLSLWDAPIIGKNAAQEMLEDVSSSIPLSLRQCMPLLQQHGMPCSYSNDNNNNNNWFDNLSLLFGIGQHITLTLHGDEDGNDNSTNDKSSIQLLQSLVLTNLLERHASTRVALRMLQSILSNWLQTAMNMAVASCHCALPVFGIWAVLPREKDTENTTSRPTLLSRQQQRTPSAGGGGGGLHDTDHTHTHTRSSYNNTHLWWWNQPIMDSDTLQQQIQRFYKQRKRQQPKLQLQHLNTCQLPSLLNGQLYSPDLTSSFVCTSIPWNTISTSSSSRIYLSTWGDLLMREANVESVALWSARHEYMWNKPTTDDSNNNNNSFENSWRHGGGLQADDDGDGDVVMQQKDSTVNNFSAYRRSCEQQALTLIEQALGATKDNPLWGPSNDPIASLHVKATWNGLPSSTSSTVDPLISFPLKVRSKQMSETDWKEMEESMEAMILDPHRSTLFDVRVQFDAEAAQASLATTMRCILASLIRTATLPPETLCYHLIDTGLMEGWDNQAGNMVAMGLAEVAQTGNATQALVAAMDWTHAAAELIDDLEAKDSVCQLLDRDTMTRFPCVDDESSLLKPWESSCLSNAAPPGRLLSLLFTHMARVRSPSSQAWVWISFIQELRERWDRQKYVPNMQFIARIDPVFESPKTKQSFSTQNVDSIPLNYSQQDPDDSYCLIGQKLQVVNVCIEAMTAAASLRDPTRSRRGMEHSEKRQRVENGSGLSSKDPISVPGESVEHDSDEEFFDAHDVDPDAATNGKREGARCPIEGFLLRSTGEQLYAPYLQRAYPLTDDVITERKLMIAKQDGGKATTTISQKLEIVHRLQRPKLMSDMRAFKAANPGAVYDDFAAWYGNPADPLAEYLEVDEALTPQASPAELATRSPRSAAIADLKGKLDKAAESIRTLTTTRDFWAETWEEADATAAEEQPLLFDPITMAEMALDYFETLHPANLLCQVMATNLSAAYFSLATSAGDAVNIEIISSSLKHLRVTTEAAIKALSLDVLIAATTKRPKSNLVFPSSVASVDSIAACEKACCALAESEALLARTRSV
jgi:hypothetical protein